MTQAPVDEATSGRTRTPAHRRADGGRHAQRASVVDAGRARGVSNAAAVAATPSAPGLRRPSWLQGRLRHPFRKAVELLRILRHPYTVTLRRLRAALLFRIRHPIGRLAGTLLLVALVLAGTPITTLHAHERGGHDHDHAHDAVASALTHADQDHDGPDQQEGGADPTADRSLDAVLHLHEIGTLVSTLPTISALALPELMHAPLDAGVPATSPPTAVRTPPHRPPIA